jgi:Uma2 family endonuclease
MAVAEAVITAEEFLNIPDDGRPRELVRGRIIYMNVPAPRHGQVCNQVGRLLGNYAREHDLGHVLNNDSGVLTGHDPDTVRGPDIAFFSYEDVPKGPLPRKGYLKPQPRLVVEVLSPDDRWKKVLAKVAEYLDAGVQIVCVLDPDEEKAYVYHADKPEQIFDAAEELSFPGVFGEFRTPVRAFFE